MLQGRSLEHIWEMGMLGFPTKLNVEDVDWLLEDGRKRTDPREQRLAAHTALEIWRDAGSSDLLLRRIQDATRDRETMSTAVSQWLAPHPLPPGHLEQERRMKAITERGRRQRAKIDQSWIDLAADMRSNPGQLRKLNPVGAKGVDARLFHLWQLLQWSVPQRARYAIDDVSPLEQMIGLEATLAARNGLIGLWRQWKPHLKSERDPANRSMINSIDCMGIAGITLEARESPDWAKMLSSDEARRAVEYATLELSEFPSWIKAIATTHPAELREVLLKEVMVEILRVDPSTHADVLGCIDRADASLSTAMASDLLDELKGGPNIPRVQLTPMLRIITRGLCKPKHGEFGALCRGKFMDIADPAIASLYLRSAFVMDPDVAMDAFIAKLDRLEKNEQTILTTHAMPAIFGNRFGPDDAPAIQLSAENLERLVVIAFRTIRTEDDNDRASGEVFSPNTRDDAERARNNVFGLLVQTSGRATFDAINRLRQLEDFQVPEAWLKELAFERAANDAEAAPWNPSDLLAFEKTAETAPRVSKDLQHVVMRRLADIQHDLLHSDFAQGGSVKALPAEVDAQNWVADRLRLKQGRSFSVEREPHVIDEKEPDIRVRAKASDASVPIEIKIAESWTLEALEAALVDQLCGRYLRAADGRHGILLLVHQILRPNGWKHRQRGGFLTFPELVAHLREMAAQICGASWDGPQPSIAVLDVSSCPSLEERRGGNRQLETLVSNSQGKTPADR
jgi:hypothetical protein